MQKISFIYPSDLGSLKLDENGNYLVPEGFEIYKVPTAEEVKANRIVEIQDQIDKFNLIPEPSDIEYLEFGKMTHPYFHEKKKIDALKAEITGI
jgi:hypothetical protein